MKLINRYGFMIILILLAIFFPQSLSNHAKLTMRVIITGFAVDKQDNAYEVTAQAVIPSPSIQGGSGEAKIDFISEQGKSVSDCINKIAYKIGKTDALSHTNFVMLGEGIVAENIISQLDYFNRSEKLADNIMVLITEGKAKDMIQKTKDLDMSVAVAMQRLFLDKEQNINGLMTPVVNIYNSAHSLAKSLVISGIKIQNENEQGDKANKSSGESGVSLSSSGGVTSGSEGAGESSSGSSGSNESGSSQGGSQGGTDAGKGQARIEFLNDIYLFENGNLVSKLTNKDMLLGFYMAQKKSSYGDISFQLIDRDYHEITLGINIRDKKVKITYDFKDNKPIVNINVIIEGARIYEITDAEQSANGLFYEEGNKSIEHYRKEIGKYVESIIEDLCEYTQDLNFDLFEAADNLHKTHYNDWSDYHEIMGDNGYVGYIEYNVSCEVKNLY